MNASKIIRIAALLLAIPVSADEANMKAQWDAIPEKPECSEADVLPCKLYKYDGETFKLTFDPDAYRIAVEGKGLTAFVYIHESTRKFRESLEGWGTDQSSLDAALEGACRRIVNLAKEPRVEELQKRMREYFDDLP
ncbi:MAG: hypothetical protein OXI90_17470 [Gammaproteobacteria bacterium]|nr:hypothetical protein [Gammaproteobacteria bacterium]